MASSSTEWFDAVWNRRCNRGGYELDRLVTQMVRGGVAEMSFKLECEGHEGTSKTQDSHHPCMFSIKGTIKLKRKTIVP